MKTIEEVNSFFDPKRLELIAANTNMRVGIPIPEVYDTEWHYTPLLEAERVEMITLSKELADLDHFDIVKLDIVQRAKTKSGKRMFAEKDVISHVMKKMLMWPYAEIERMNKALNNVDKQVAKTSVEDIAGNSDEMDTNLTSQP